MSRCVVSRCLLFAALFALGHAGNSSATDDDHHDDDGHDGDDGHYGDDGHHGDDDHHGAHHGQYHHFHNLYFLLLFTLLVWCGGKASAAIGIPSLVGEIIAGVLLGPATPWEALHFVERSDAYSALKVLGEIGLCLHALEAGLHVDLEMLEIVGLRSISVGFFGSVLPAALAGTMASYWGATSVGAFCVGVSMATMSPPIAFNVLKAGGVLNQARTASIARATVFVPPPPARPVRVGAP